MIMQSDIAQARLTTPASLHTGVCRAENSYTHRHMCEFTGLDFEMAIYEHYFEVRWLLKKVAACI